MIYTLYHLLAKFQTTSVYFEGGYQETKVFHMGTLSHGQIVRGPAIIMDSLSTLIIEPDCTASITLHGDVKIEIGEGVKSKITTELDAIQLSIFSHRFMSTAEQMGRYVITFLKTYSIVEVIEILEIQKFWKF